MRRLGVFLLLVAACAAATQEGAPAEPPAPVVLSARVDTMLPDRDKDGVPDGEDRCPTRYGLGLDGCELPDRDNDAVIDRDDACIDLPETPNGVADEDGCPDQIPEALRRALRPIPRPASTTDTQEHARMLSRAQKAALRRVAAALRAYPDVRIEIVGHQGHSGEIKYGMTPSGVAARAAKEFLVEDEGIEADRIEWNDAGSNELLASNRTAAGRAKNRRLEFRLIVEEPGQREPPPLLH